MLKAILVTYGRDFIAIAATILVLAAILYARKRAADTKGRVAPYREPLVPEDFWRSVPAQNPEGSADRPVVVWIVRHWLPATRSGATTMAYEMSRFLKQVAGWHVIVITPYSPVAAYDDMPILTFDQRPLVELAIKKAHVIMTQYQVIETAAATAQRARKPLVLVAHDDSLNPWITLAKTKCGTQNVGLITNSEWLDTLYRFQGVASVVLYPPVYIKAYQTHTTRTYVTLVNCNENKGALLFYRVAKALPEFQFLAVAGSYGEQVSPPRLPNLTAWGPQADMRRVYAVTGILLAPSKAESWGRVAIEAAASGIPVIAAPTPGLKEALGPAGIFCDREDTAAWVTEIRRLQNSVADYEQASRAVARRAASLDPTEQLERMRGFLLDRRWVEAAPLEI